MYLVLKAIFTALQMQRLDVKVTQDVPIRLLRADYNFPTEPNIPTPEVVYCSCTYLYVYIVSVQQLFIMYDQTDIRS